MILQRVTLCPQSSHVLQNFILPPQSLDPPPSCSSLSPVTSLPEVFDSSTADSLYDIMSFSALFTSCHHEYDPLSVVNITLYHVILCTQRHQVLQSSTLLSQSLDPFTACYPLPHLSEVLRCFDRHQCYPLSCNPLLSVTPVSSEFYTLLRSTTIS